MRNALFHKLKESFLSILPITIIVIILGVSLTPLPATTLINFVICCVLLIVGIALFTLGADTAMLPIGQHMGGYLSKKSKPLTLVLFCFVLGVVITIAEPDLTVLASQISSINNWLFIVTVSVGVGLFLVLGILRILFKWKFNLVIALCYILVFLLTIFVEAGIIPVSFDSGSVTTGPISVPFIMAFGLGLAQTRGSNAKEDSFGLIGFASFGPILVVMILMWAMGVNSAEPAVSDNLNFLSATLKYLKEVFIILLPIAVIFILFQIFALKLPKKEITRIIIGLIYTYIGITIFLVGVNVGFLPVGTIIGESLAQNFKYLLIPVCAIIGFCMAMVEPAVQVLAKQIQNVTNSIIKKKTIIYCIATGVSLALMLCAVRILTHISILWILVPAYTLTIILSFVVPKLFVGMAYDSGGVATGAIATTFALPLVMGAVVSVGGNLMLDAFGTLALVAIAPILVVLVFGLIYQIGVRKTSDKDEELKGLKRVDIIEYD